MAVTVGNFQNFTLAQVSHFQPLKATSKESNLIFNCYFYNNSKMLLADWMLEFLIKRLQQQATLILHLPIFDMIPIFDMKCGHSKRNKLHFILYVYKAILYRTQQDLWSPETRNKEYIHTNYIASIVNKKCRKTGNIVYKLTSISTQ